jgi:1-phosphatidylinositol-4-phosphate 5-kinase
LFLSAVLAYPSSGDHYEGTVRGKIPRPHKKGICKYGGSLDGFVYDGDWVDGKWKGKGIMTFHSGEKYDGDFGDDMFKGKGKNDFL